MRRVVITGIGARTPVGGSYEEMHKSVKEEKCGISKIEKFDASEIGITAAGEIKDFDFSAYMSKKEARRMDLVNQYGVAAAKDAYEDAGFEEDQLRDNDRASVIVASGIGGIETIENDVKRVLKRGYDKMSPFFVPMSIINMTGAHVGIALGINGENYTPVTACSGSTDAVGQAYRHIKDGYSDICVTGGAEAAITPAGVAGFASMRALSTSTDVNRASIPFDKERDGFVMGEGAGILVLEELDHAKDRGAKIYAEIVGYFATSDAYHITAPIEDGRYAARAMEKAIDDAGIQADQIDYINAHGTSTPLNDKTETKAIKTALGSHAKDLYISSTKSMTGHLLGATGAVEIIFTTIALKEGIIPATLNYKVPDEDCDLNYVTQGHIEKEINYGMSNTLGFGGHNSSIIIKRWVD